MSEEKEIEGGAREKNPPLVSGLFRLSAWGVIFRQVVMEVFGLAEQNRYAPPALTWGDPNDDK